jgi:hypothetical protein
MRSSQLYVVGLRLGYELTPQRLMKIRTTVFFIIGSFLNSVMLMPVNYLLPQFFQGVSLTQASADNQVRGSTVIESGIQLIPYSVVIAFSSILAGELTNRTHIIRPVIWVGFGMTSLGFGLFYAFFTKDVTVATQTGLLSLASFGTGLSITTPMLVIQAAMPLEDMAAATSAWVLVRSFGATIGESVHVHD